MERKNTVLLTVIAVATLLVAVVGATFAYFTATNSTGDVTGSDIGNITTTKLGKTTFTFNGSDLAHKYLDYPGGLAVIGSKAEFTKDGEDDNDYNLKFDLEINYTNSTQTDLLWALYMVEGDALESNLDPECKLYTKPVNTETHFWYADQDSGNTYDTKSCTLTVTQKESLSSTTMIAYGKFEKNKSSNQIIDGSTVSEGAKGEGNETSIDTCQGTVCNPDGTSVNPLSGRTLDSKSITSKYYYLVVQYPNENRAQAQEALESGAANIQATLKVKDESASVTVSE